MAIRREETYYLLKSNSDLADEFEYTKESRDVALTNRNNFRKANPSLNWQLFYVVVTTVTSLVEE